MSVRGHRPFVDRRPEDYPKPDLNPYLKRHREWGPPVVIGEDGPGYRGRWGDAFARPQPLHLEIGPGNGFHLAGMAALHPERNWLGVEIRFKRVVLCARKIERAGVTDNARILRYDAWWLDYVFAPGELAGLYINHPDPWKKDRHSDKRLMSPFFARMACLLLRPGAPIRVKTDHRPNIDRFVAAFDGLPLRVIGRSDDILAQGPPWDPEDDVTTNYESKFHERNEPIYCLLAQRTRGPAPVLDEHGPDSDADRGASS